MGVVTTKMRDTIVLRFVGGIFGIDNGKGVDVRAIADERSWMIPHNVNVKSGGGERSVYLETLRLERLSNESGSLKLAKAQLRVLVQMTADSREKSRKLLIYSSFISVSRDFQIWIRDNRRFSNRYHVFLDLHKTGTTASQITAVE